MRYGIKKTLRISEEMWIYCVYCITIILLFLPLVNVINSVIIGLFKIFVGCIFLMVVAAKNKQIFSRFVLILLISLLCNAYYYYNCWRNYSSIGFFMVNSLLCWVYMEMGVFLFLYTTEKTKKKVTSFLLVIMVVTALTTLITLQSYPETVRALGNANEYLEEVPKFFYLRNTANWAILYSMVYFLPIVINLFWREKQIRKLVFLLIMELCILKSQITFAVLLSFGFLVFLVIKPTAKSMLIIASAGLVTLLIIYEFIDDIFFFLYNLMLNGTSEVLTRRIYQLYVTFHTGRFFGDAAARMDLYGRSIFTFLKNPIFGLKIENEPIGSAIGLHSQILDMLGATGLFGIFLCMISFCYLLLKVYNKINVDQTQKYFLLSVIGLVILMLINPTYYCPEIYFIVFSLPALSNS